MTTPFKMPNMKLVIWISVTSLLFSMEILFDWKWLENLNIFTSLILSIIMILAILLTLYTIDKLIKKDDPPKKYYVPVEKGRGSLFYVMYGTLTFLAASSGHFITAFLCMVFMVTIYIACQIYKDKTKPHGTDVTDTVGENISCNYDMEAEK